MNKDSKISALSKDVYAEVAEVFKDIKGVEFTEVISLFFQVLTLPITTKDIDVEGLESRTINSIERILKKDILPEDRETFLADFGKIEPFLKKITFLIFPDKYQELNPHNQIPKGLTAYLEVLKIKPDVSLERDPYDFRGNTKYWDHIIRVYQYRNRESHDLKKYSLVKYYELVQSILVVYVFVTYLYRKQLAAKVATVLPTDIPSFNNYCLDIIQQFTNRISRFIPLNSKEEIKLAGSYVSEHLLKEDEDVKFVIREGTVDSLRTDGAITENRMIIWAEAGMGKSTTLEYLAYKDAKNKLKLATSKVPVYIPLGLLTDQSISIKKYINLKLNIEDSLCESLFNTGNLNIFLDGINEIPIDSNLRNTRLKEIEGLLKEYPKCFFIITNRPEKENVFSGIPIFFIQKMNNNQIKEFINKYSDGDKNVERLISNSLDANGRLKEIVRSPLMLSRLIEIVKSEGTVPGTDTKIIDRFIKTLYKRERIEKKDANFNEDAIHYMLAHLGFYSKESKGTNSGLTKGEIFSNLKTTKNDYGFQIDVSYVLQIVTQLNILEEREGVFCFAHQEYQDYYEGEYLKILFPNDTV